MLIPVTVAITIISLFCVQALIFCLLLLFKKPHTQANSLLSMVLFFFALAAFNLALFYLLVLTGNTRFIPFVQIELLFGLGPSLYLYTKSVTDAQYKISKWEYGHFMPVLLEFVYYRTSYYRMGMIGFTENHRNIWNQVFITEQWAGTIFTTLYIGLTLKLLYDYYGWVRNNYSNLHRRTLNWLMKPVIAYASFWILWHMIRLVDLFLYDESYRDYYYYPMFIILSGITCWIGFKGYVKTQLDLVGFTAVDKLQRKPSIQHATEPSGMGNLFRDVMEHQKLYLDMDLSLDTFSKALSMNPKQVSKIINSELNMNFHEFVNKYRVSAFIERLKNPGHQKLTIWGHALESGFASKSSFNYIFKKYTNLTPKQYYAGIWNELPNNMSEKMILDD